MFMSNDMAIQFDLCPDAMKTGYDKKTMRQKLYEHGADQFLTEEGEDEHDTFLNAMSHCKFLNDTFFDDHLSFCVVRLDKDFYVLDKVYAKELNIISDESMTINEDYEYEKEGGFDHMST